MRAVMGTLQSKTGAIDFDGQICATPLRTGERILVSVLCRRSTPSATTYGQENILLPTWTINIEGQRIGCPGFMLMPEVEEFRNRGATELSGGQQKFVAFPRALMVGTKLLMLDEPSEGIAPVFAQRMVEIMAT